MTLLQVENKIHTIRNQQVMLDRDLSEMYGVENKRLNEQVKRNKERFPGDFMFQISEKELGILRSQNEAANISSKSRTLPFAFTEYGCLMAANVLNSDRAIKVSQGIIRIFSKMKKALPTGDDNDVLSRAIEIIGKKKEEKLTLVAKLNKELDKAEGNVSELSKLQGDMEKYLEPVKKVVEPKQAKVVGDNFSLDTKTAPFCTTQIMALQLGTEFKFPVSVHLFNSILEKLGIQEKTPDTRFDVGYHWELTPAYRNRGYQTYYINQNGNLTYHGWMRWTLKGSLFAMEKVRSDLLKRGVVSNA